MKTDQELVDDIRRSYDSNKFVKGQLMYNLISTGDIVSDFSKFTDLQSGKKSDDPKDSAAHFPPPTPAKDGKYYHTIRDITWQTYHTLLPLRTANDFYNMSDGDRNFVVSRIMSYSAFTSDKIINAFLSYLSWASGNYHNEMNVYSAWYKSDIRKDLENISRTIILNRLVDIRLYTYSQMRQFSTYGSGWQAGILNLWHLLLQYIA